MNCRGPSWCWLSVERVQPALYKQIEYWQFIVLCWARAGLQPCWGSIYPWFAPGPPGLSTENLVYYVHPSPWMIPTLTPLTQVSDNALLSEAFSLGVCRLLPAAQDLTNGLSEKLAWAPTPPLPSLHQKICWFLCSCAGAPAGEHPRCSAPNSKSTYALH